MKFAALAQYMLLAGSVEAYKKCNYQHADVKTHHPGSVRIVFVGDKLVSGEMEAPIPTDETVFDVADETDGTHWGYQGFPYWFGELLKEKKPKQKFEIMNFGGLDYGIKSSFWDTCDYQKSLRSEPKIVVMGFGGSELAALKTHEDRQTFQNKYIALGRQYLSLPSQPQLFLLTPPALHLDEEVPEPVAGGPFADTVHENRHFYSTVSLPMLLKSVGDGLSLPAENRIDLFTPFGGASLTEGLDLLNGDKITPNAEGQNKIATQLYNQIIKFNNFNNHEELYKIGRKVIQDPNPWGI